MSIDEVVRRLFDGLEEYEPHPETWETKLSEAMTALEELRREKQWAYEQLDDWCWADSNRAFDYIFGA